MGKRSVEDPTVKKASLHGCFRWAFLVDRSSWRRVFPGVVAVVVGAFIFTEIRGRFASGNSRTLVAKRELPIGHPLDLGDITLEPKGFPGGITDQELHLLKNAVVVRSIQRGAPLTWDQLSVGSERLSTSIPRGMRAHTVRPQNYLQIFAKDRVDLVWSPKEAEPVILVEAVLVLQSRRQQGDWSLVVALTPEQITAVEKAADNGALSVSLRNPDEKGMVSRPKKPKHSKVEVWVERQK